MRFRVTFKTPDVLGDIDGLVEGWTAAREFPDEDSRDEFSETVRREALAVFAKWTRSSELITVEFDTEAGTCTAVLP